MNVDESGIMFTKKKNKIDDEAPVSKKAARQQRKNINKTVINSILKQDIAINQRPMHEEHQKPKQKKGPDRMIEDIKAILTNHKVSTIRAILEKHNYNKVDAMDELFETPEDETGESIMTTFEDLEKPAQRRKKQDTKEDQANKFLDEMYQTLESEGLQMNPTEFEQLFEEITFIIQEEQKNKGVGIVDINNFVDSCVSIKSIMMEGHELYIDQDDPLYRETEIFMYEIIQKTAMMEKKRQEQFPTLGSISPSKGKDSLGNKNMIEKIQESYKVEKSKQELFTPSKVPTITKSLPTYEGSIYSLNDDYQSHADVLQLSREYNNMGIENLKFIYFRLQHDFNLCKQFLDRYYPQKKSVVRVQNRNQPSKEVPVVPILSKRSYEQKKRVVDDNYKKYSLEEIREELDHLYKLRNMFRITRGKITNQSYRKQLERLSCREDPKINKLCEVARIKTIAEMAGSHPQYVDLHGYREEEVDDLMYDIKDMIRDQYRRGNPQIQTVKGGGSFCIVKVMTGKGRHSKYGKSILKPAVMDWSHSQSLKAVENEDSIDVYFKLS